MSKLENSVNESAKTAGSLKTLIVAGIAIFLVGGATFASIQRIMRVPGDVASVTSNLDTLTKRLEALEKAALLNGQTVKIYGKAVPSLGSATLTLAPTPTAENAAVAHVHGFAADAGYRWTLERN